MSLEINNILNNSFNNASVKGAKQTKELSSHSTEDLVNHATTLLNDLTDKLNTAKATGVPVQADEDEVSNFKNQIQNHGHLLQEAVKDYPATGPMNKCINRLMSAIMATLDSMNDALDVVSVQSLLMTGTHGITQALNKFQEALASLNTVLPLHLSTAGNPDETITNYSDLMQFYLNGEVVKGKVCPLPDAILAAIKPLYDGLIAAGGTDATIQTVAGVVAALTTWQNNVNYCCSAINAGTVPSTLNGQDDAMSATLTSATTSAVQLSISAATALSQQQTTVQQQDTNAITQWAQILGALVSANMAIFNGLHIQ